MEKVFEWRLQKNGELITSANNSYMSCRQCLFIIYILDCPARHIAKR
jgi:hypothetical protein